MKELPKKYDHRETEKRWQQAWEADGVYHWDESQPRENTFVIDTPPPTVSGLLHMGHIYSYTQADYIARYQRMSGKTVFYPMGFDDNGLPTERLVEKTKKVRATDMSREEFIKLCEGVSEEARADFRALFKTTALSVDWRQEYHTISEESRKISQLSFLDLFHKGYAYRKLQPMLWDPVDQTAIAQAEVVDKEIDSHFNDILFEVLAEDTKPDTGGDGSEKPSPSGRWLGEGNYVHPPKELVEKARSLRKNATDVEQLLWSLLRDRQLAGHKFRRQHPIGDYVADFFCHEANLVVELDGGQHNEEKQKQKDIKRTAFLESQGLRVIRFWNNEVLQNTEGVMETILQALTPALSQREREFITIGTTRPELIPACVAIFYHPDDKRYRHLKGKYAITPLFGVRVPIMEDDTVEMEKGTGIMMCCTFGDEADIDKWQRHDLPTRVVLNKYGKMDFASCFPQDSDGASDPDSPALPQTGSFIESLSGLKSTKAREKILELLKEAGLLVKQEKITHAVKCAERSGAPLELLPTQQWFVKVLDKKEQLKEKAAQCNWYPQWMKTRIDQWIDGLNWDWCISRQRYFGVPFPVWYSRRDGEKGRILIAEPDQLPANPLVDLPKGYMRDEVEAETDVMDTWATSSISPQLSSKGIASSPLPVGEGGALAPGEGRGLAQGKTLTPTLSQGEREYAAPVQGESYVLDYDRHQKLFPADLRPQAHEIIRTWAFYTIVKAYLHGNTIPWKNLMISGWCLAEDKSKMSKSKGNVITPIDLIEEYSADVVRYWSSTSKLGTDTAFSRDLLKIGKKLVTKLWNATKFAAIHLDKIPDAPQTALEDVRSGRISETLDLWILTRLNRAIGKSTESFEKFEYSDARAAAEDFFWNDFCDNYLELVKRRVYDEDGDSRQGQLSAAYTIYHCLDGILRLFAPILPHITEELWSHIFEDKFSTSGSVHARGNWPDAKDYPLDENAETAGISTVAILEMIRKAKSEKGVSIKYPLEKVIVAAQENASPIAASAQSDLRGAGNIASLEWRNSTEGDEISGEGSPFMLTITFSAESDVA